MRSNGEPSRGAEVAGSGHEDSPSGDPYEFYTQEGPESAKAMSIYPGGP